MLLQGGVETIRAVEPLRVAMGSGGLQKGYGNEYDGGNNIGVVAIWQSVDPVFVIVVMVTTTTTTAMEMTMAMITMMMVVVVMMMPMMTMTMI